MEKLILEAKGLSTYADPASERKQGSLKTAENIVIDKDGVFSPRRGFQRLDGLLDSPATSMTVFDGDLHVFSNSTLQYYDEAAGTFAVYTSPTLSNTTCRYAQSNGNLYMTSSQGILKLDDRTNDVVESGVTQGLDGSGTLIAISGGLLAADTATSYRVLWGIKDANSNLILGAPSQRIFVTNAGGGSASNVALSFTVPDEITTDYFYQIYRTGVASGAANDPGDEHRLVYEDSFVSYSTAAVTVSDSGGKLLFTKSSHGLVAGVELTFTNVGGALPTGISAATKYYVIANNADSFFVATSIANALAGTPTKIAYTAPAGTGTHTATPNNKIITIMDVTDDSLRDLASELYSNATVEGALQANNQPPKSDDIALYNGFMFFSNLTYSHTYTFTILGCGGTAGLKNDDTFVIAGSTYTAKAAENIASKQFILSATGTPGFDIRVTAESLVRCINQNASNTTVYAFYDSMYGELPGKIRIVERDYGGSAFTLATTAYGTATSPDLSTTRTSTAETIPNGLAFSKFEQPEAVPAVNLLRVGPKNFDILRIIPLRDALFILTEGGVYRLTGTSTANFSVDLLDDTTKLLAPNTAVTVNNMVYGLFDQGVCRVSESGVTIISREIEGDIKSWMGSHISDLRTKSFAMTYETDRKFMMAVPSTASLSYPDVMYVYNTVTDSWTTYERPIISGVVNTTTDRWYMCPNKTSSSKYYLAKERKNFDFTDFADEQVDTTLSSITTTEITLPSVVGVKDGDIFLQTQNVTSSTLRSTWSHGDFIVITDNDSNTWGVYIDASLGAPSGVIWSGINAARKTNAVEGLTSTVTAAAIVTAFQSLSGFSDKVFITSSGPTVTVQVADAGAISLPVWHDIGETATGTSVGACSIDWASGSDVELYTTVTDVDDLTNVITVASELDFLLGPAEVRSSFESIVEWNPIHLNSAASMKQFSEATLIMNQDFESATLSFKTDLSSEWVDIDLTGNEAGNWGLFDWGLVPWGGLTDQIVCHRTYVPKEKQRGNVLNVKFSSDTAFSDWEVSGVEITYRNSTPRSGRR